MGDHPQQNARAHNGPADQHNRVDAEQLAARQVQSAKHRQSHGTREQEQKHDRGRGWDPGREVVYPVPFELDVEAGEGDGQQQDHRDRQDARANPLFAKASGGKPASLVRRLLAQPHVSNTKLVAGLDRAHGGGCVP